MAASPSTARTYRSARQVERHASILAAARDLLAEKGYDGVTMNELADRAGVVKKTLYNIYGGKDDLLLAAISEIINEYQSAGSDAEPGIPAIMASRRAAARQVMATPAYSDAMTIALLQASPEHPLIQMLLKDSIAFVIEQLDIERRNGGLAADVPIQELAELIVSQGWGRVILKMKDVIALEDFERKSTVALLLLLQGVTQGARHAQICEQLKTLNTGNQRRSTP